MFFLVAAGFSAMAFASCQKRWAVIISVLVMPVVGSWSYSILLLFSPGDLSVGPCVERSTWTAFPAMYLTTSCAALLNNTLWKNWFVAAIGSVIALTAAILLLRNLF
jgi:hypothetical protein